jgi:RNA polymerase sigma-70 factor (sigma-E family)
MREEHVTTPADVRAPDGATDDLTVFVAARGAALQRFAYLVTGDRAESADLVQDALANAWPRWEALSRKGTLEAYLRRSITNGAISRWRKLGRVTPVAETPDTATPAVDPSDADQAWRLCAGLPPLQRAAVVLRFYEDLSYAEIATVLACAEPTARSHVHRALLALRGRLTPGADDARSH